MLHGLLVLDVMTDDDADCDLSGHLLRIANARCDNDNGDTGSSSLTLYVHRGRTDY